MLNFVEKEDIVNFVQFFPVARQAGGAEDKRMFMLTPTDTAVTDGVGRGGWGGQWLLSVPKVPTVLVLLVLTLAVNGARGGAGSGDYQVMVWQW